MNLTLCYCGSPCRLCDDNNLQDEILSDEYIGAVLEWSKVNNDYFAHFYRVVVI